MNKKIIVELKNQDVLIEEVFILRIFYFQFDEINQPKRMGVFGSCEKKPEERIEKQNPLSCLVTREKGEREK